MTFSNIKLIHLVVVNLFLVLYLVKTILLVANKSTSLNSLTKAMKVPEMIISTLFLITGVWMIILMGGILHRMMIIKIVIVLAAIPMAIIGFKKQNKALAVFAFLFVVGAYGIAEMAKVPKVKPTPEGQAISGVELYKSNCQSCHGPKGDMGNNGAADLSLSSIDHNKELQIINDGKKPMPAYNSLSAPEKDSLITFIEGLRTK
jgi:mono/diheme cytochrome c family protein